MNTEQWGPTHDPKAPRALLVHGITSSAETMWGPTTHPLGVTRLHRPATTMRRSLSRSHRVELGQSSSRFRVRSTRALIRASISSIVADSDAI